MATIFDAEIRRRIEKTGIREVDNNMTLALLTRSVLIKVAADLSKYLESEYIPQTLVGRQTYVAKADRLPRIEWPRKLSSVNIPVRIYNSIHLSDQERQQLGTVGSEALEFKEVATPQEISSAGAKLLEPGDSLVYKDFASPRKPPIALKVDMPDDVGFHDLIASSLMSVIQETLSKQLHAGIEVDVPALDAWPLTDAGSVNLIVSDIKTSMTGSGCVASFILRTWAGSTVRELSTFDKTKVFY